MLQLWLSFEDHNCYLLVGSASYTNHWTLYYSGCWFCGIYHASVSLVWLEICQLKPQLLGFCAQKETVHIQVQTLRNKEVSQLSVCFSAVIFPGPVSKLAHCMYIWFPVHTFFHWYIPEHHFFLTLLSASRAGLTFEISFWNYLV